LHRAGNNDTAGALSIVQTFSLTIGNISHQDAISEYPVIECQQRGLVKRGPTHTFTANTAYSAVAAAEPSRAGSLLHPERKTEDTGPSIKTCLRVLSLWLATVKLKEMSVVLNTTIM
jgi:hypothetical protein